MPYHVVKSGDKYCVEKKDGSKRFGCHDTEAEADKQVAALYANEPRHAEEARFVTLLGATGQPRKEFYQGREWTAVPIVALVEGVIHAVNAPEPELVRASLFPKALSEWDGKPVFSGHPMKDGVPVDGLLPDVLPSSFGEVRYPMANAKSLNMEGWLDHARCAEGTPGARILERVWADPPKPIEVSVGAWTYVSRTAGTWSNGKKYAGEWTGWKPNHLALLENQRGACNLEMGCGTHRVAMRVAEDGQSLEVLGDKPGHEFHGNQYTDGMGDGQFSANHSMDSPPKEGAVIQVHGPEITDPGTPNVYLHGTTGTVISKRMNANGYVKVKSDATKEVHRMHVSVLRPVPKKEHPMGLMARMMEAFRSLMPRGWSNTEVSDELRQALAGVEPGVFDIVSWTDDRVVYCVWPSMNAAYNNAQISSPEYYARSYSFDKDKQTFTLGDRVEVEPTMTYPAITAAQESQDATEPTLKAACSCGSHAADAAGESTMERKERIAALVANPHNPVKSLKMLETATDEELAGLEATAGTMKAAAEKSAQDAAALKAAQDKAEAEKKATEAAEAALKAAQGAKPEPETEEQFLARNPGLKAIVDGHRIAQEAQKSALVASIRAASQAFTEEQLKAKTVEELTQLAALAKVEAPKDYSGLPVPRAAAAPLNDLASFAAPDAYAVAAK